ncbi:hypothetical protein BDF14DRAFT_258309 [Spinellus fusiger]|nr:hypothetical protein BDF14DRAFT_258309 [Spinellus fusiger]
MGLFSRSKNSVAPPAYTEKPTLQQSPRNSHGMYAPPPMPQERTNPDSRSLPQGWISQYDPSSGKFFYVYEPTALRQWQHPSDVTRGENSSYTAQQPQQGYYPTQQQQPMPYAQPQQSRMGGINGLRPGGGVLLGSALSDMHHPDVVNNNYYDTNGDYGGGYGGGYGGDYGGGDFGGDFF